MLLLTTCPPAAVRLPSKSRVYVVRVVCVVSCKVSDYSYTPRALAVVSTGICICYSARASIVAVRSFQINAKCFRVRRWSFSSTSVDKGTAQVGLLAYVVSGADSHTIPTHHTLSLVLFTVPSVLVYTHLLQHNIAEFCVTST